MLCLAPVFPRRVRGAALLAAAATLLAACNRTPDAPLQVLWPVPAFDLTDQTGESVSNTQLEGRVWATDFFFTACPAICPLLTRAMGEVRDAVADELAAGDAALVGFSLQPENDTPEVLAAYGASHGATPGQWYLLTGERQAIWKISEHGFKLGVDAIDNPANPISHNGKISLVDRRGQVRGIYEGVDPESVQHLIRDMKRLLDDPSL